VTKEELAKMLDTDLKLKTADGLLKEFFRLVNASELKSNSKTLKLLTRTRSHFDSRRKNESE
jgi:hypothetical protein